MDVDGVVRGWGVVGGVWGGAGVYHLQEYAVRQRRTRGVFNFKGIPSF